MSSRTAASDEIAGDAVGEGERMRSAAAESDLVTVQAEMH